MANPTDPHSKRVAEDIQRIKEEYDLERKKVLRFRWADGIGVPDEEDPRLVIYPRSTSIHCRQVLHGDNGMEEWRYFETEDLVKGRVVTNPPKLRFTGNLRAGMSNIELTWFLLVAASEVVGSQNPSKGVRMVQADRPEVDARKVIERERRNVQLKNMLYGDTALTDDEVLQVGQALGIGGDDAGVMRVTIDKLAHFSGGFERVNEAISNNPFLNAKRAVQKAVSERKLGIDQIDGKSVWRRIDEELFVGEPICTIPKTRKPMSVIVKHVMENGLELS